VLGNLRSVSLPDGTGIDYLVDARHRRIGRKVDGTLERGWLWASQLAPAAELDGAGQVVGRYVHATRVNVPDLVLRDGTTYRILSDPLGSPRLAVDATTGAVVQRMDYDEWGVVLLDTNPGWQPFGFAGGLYDTDTGLVRFGWRDYDPIAGRWTSKDPILFQGRSGNLFEYVESNPTNASDPNGLVVGGLFCKAFRRALGKTEQEAAIAGMVGDGLIGTANELARDTTLDARGDLPVAVDFALDVDQGLGGYGLVRLGVEVGRQVVVGGAIVSAETGLAVGAAFAGGYLLGRAADRAYRHLGGPPLGDVLFDWILDPLPDEPAFPTWTDPGCSGDGC
ncbi:MAG: RHS repeat-associated core domain-containing protein, partial [Thermoanaerobaculia bacterium]|nr:RHS repeat-associated core domain-containing protein [Thermoanaerobaculia bacterium]